MSHRPVLFVLAGVDGTGKSSVGGAVIRQAGAAWPHRINIWLAFGRGSREAGMTFRRSEFAGDSAALRKI